MNIKALCLISTALISSQVGAIEIFRGDDGSLINLYGRIQATYNINDNNKDDGSDNDSDVFGSTSNRFGLNGRQTINDDMSVIGQMQYQLISGDANNDVKWSVRYLWAGVDMKENGRIEGHRVLSGMTMLTDTTDFFHDGGDPIAGYHAGTVDNTAVQMFRQNGTLQYRNSFGDFDVTAAFIANTSVDSAYNLGARYNFDINENNKLKFIGIFQQSKEKSSELGNASFGNANAVSDYSVYGLGVQYNVGDFYFGGNYAIESMDIIGGTVDTTAYDFATSYNLSKKITLKANYRNLQFDDVDAGSKSDSIIDGYVLEAQYKLTQRSNLYLTYVDNDGYGSELKATGKAETGTTQAGTRLMATFRFEF